jgi:hypothetical protein
MPTWLSTLIYHLGMRNRLVGGSSSETESILIDVIMIIKVLVPVAVTYLTVTHLTVLTNVLQIELMLAVKSKHVGR